MNTSNLHDGPALDSITVTEVDLSKGNTYPFSIPLIRNLKTVTFPTQVTFFVGENGTGKSTILEAIAYEAGFGAEGGSRNINFKTSEDKDYSGAEFLASCMRLSWRRIPKDGYFFRAESFFNLATYIEQLGDGSLIPYGGKSLHEQSHGESFLAFFKNRVGTGGFFHIR